jgi:hypothetical protein
MSNNTFCRHQGFQQVNPIKRKFVHKNIHLNSKFRDDYYNTASTNFKYTFSETLEKVISIKLSSISIPNSWYLFSHERGNNRFYIEEVGKDCCNMHEIVIPDGNYDRKQLETYLNGKYFYKSTTQSMLKFIKFSINENSMKSCFEVLDDLSGDGTKFNISFTNEKTESLMFTAGWILGFRHGKYLNLNSYVLSEGLFDAGGDRYLYLCLKDYNRNVSNSNVVYFDDTTMSNDVLAKIYLVDGKFAINFDTTSDDNSNFSKTREYFGPITFKKFDIQLLDQYGKQINLNNMDFSFTLEIKQQYNNL